MPLPTGTGRSEVWVKPLGSSSSGAMQQVSRDGGSASRWSRDGRELFFTVPNGLMAVSVNYDVGTDGQFLLVQALQPTRPATSVEVVLNGLARVR